MEIFPQGGTFTVMLTVFAAIYRLFSTFSFQLAMIGERCKLSHLSPFFQLSPSASSDIFMLSSDIFMSSSDIFINYRPRLLIFLCRQSPSTVNCHPEPAFSLCIIFFLTVAIPSDIFSTVTTFPLPIFFQFLPWLCPGSAPARPGRGACRSCRQDRQWVPGRQGRQGGGGGRRAEKRVYNFISRC